MGAFPQSLDDMWNKQTYFKNEDGEDVIGPSNIHKNLKALELAPDHIGLLNKALKPCTDIEDLPLLDSHFKFVLPHSTYNINLPDDQPKFLVRQTGALYIWDWNKRFNYGSTNVICASNINKLKRVFDLGSVDEDISYDTVLTKIAEQIDGPLEDTKLWLDEKPVSLAEMAIVRGLASMNKIVTKKWVKEFKFNIDDEDISDVVEIQDDIIYMDKLLNKDTSKDYYKYICEQKLHIQPNIELYNTFYDTFVCADEFTRLKLITNSKFLAKVLCDETDY
jgi:hypothetical protein